MRTPGSGRDGDRGIKGTDLLGPHFLKHLVGDRSSLLGPPDGEAVVSSIEQLAIRVDIPATRGLADAG